MKALVTGGGGFLGGAIVRQLLARGDTVRSVSRGYYPDLPCEQVQGDLAEPGVAERAMAGCDLVFHVAAKAGVAGRERDYVRANVEATQRVIDACHTTGVRRLVYTSSPSVVFTGRDLEGVDESVPYPDHYLAAYPRTKAEAERRVLAANSETLATVALRPHLIWGPGDNHLVPRILDRGRAGRLRQIGRGKKVDSTYIDNAARAHLLAADQFMRATAEKPAACAGKAYFISNGEPMPTWELVNRILAAGGVAPVTRRVSPWLAYAAGALLETVYGVWWPDAEPPLTRFVAAELATSHWFDLTAARRDLNYEPVVTIEEGLRRLQQALMGSR